MLCLPKTFPELIEYLFLQLIQMQMNDVDEMACAFRIWTEMANVYATLDHNIENTYVNRK